MWVFKQKGANHDSHFFYDEKIAAKNLSIFVVRMVTDTN